MALYIRFVAGEWVAKEYDSRRRYDGNYRCNGIADCQALLRKSGGAQWEK